MKKFTLYLIAILLFSNTDAQDKKDQLFDISLHGFVAVDAAHNTRVSRIVRNQHIFLYPLPANIDEATGNDLNNRGNSDIDAAHSRFGLHITGPTLNGISVFGLIEADFLGDARFADSNFRLRHAFVRFGYQNFSLLAGQTWHPFFIPENFPQIINTSAGVPMHPLSRNPQIRLSWKKENVEILAAFIEQNNFRTAGFPKGSELAEIPELTMQVKIGGSGPAWASFSAGFKRLAIPDQFDPSKNGATVDGFHYQSTFRYRFPGLTFRAGGLYGQNVTELVVPGGVGRVLTSTNERPKYEPLAAVTGWADINSNNTTWDPGIFAGFMKAMGASREVIVIEELALDPKVTNVFSIAPRLRYHVAPFAWIALEYMYTRAGWGDSFDDYGAPYNLTYYTNHRSLLSFRYTF